MRIMFMHKFSMLVSEGNMVINVFENSGEIPHVSDTNAIKSREKTILQKVTTYEH